MKFYPLMISVPLYSILSLPIAISLDSQNEFNSKLAQTLSQLPDTPQRPESEGDGGGTAWRKIFPNSRPPSTPRRGGSEGGGERGNDDTQVCAIAPNYSGTLQVWSDKPTLTWTGKVTQVEIRASDSQDALWGQKISVGDQVTLDLPTPLILNQVTVATPLEPGQTYRWYISDKSSGAYDKYFPVEFKLMTVQERAVVAQELQQLEQELAAQNITGDAAKLRRADYFANRELWLDFWQEVLSIQSPSEELKNLLSSTVDELCQ